MYSNVPIVFAKGEPCAEKPKKLAEPEIAQDPQTMQGKHMLSPNGASICMIPASTELALPSSSTLLDFFNDDRPPILMRHGNVSVVQHFVGGKQYTGTMCDELKTKDKDSW